ncbi:MAG: hypothetical protein KGN02_00655 [bacterium]|nr:hypothetical protein [bacterium]
MLFAGALATIATTNACIAAPATAIETQPSAPVQITACTSATGHSSGVWGTDSDGLHLAVSFRNRSAKVVSAVLVGFQLQNQFGDTLGRVSTQATGHFSPGVLIENQHWDGENDWPGFSTLICSVKRVLYSDGTVWSAR